MRVSAGGSRGHEKFFFYLLPTAATVAAAKTFLFWVIWLPVEVDHLQLPAA